MGTILVYLQSNSGDLAKSDLVAIAAALELKARWGSSEIHGLCLGTGAQAAAEQAAKYGLNKVLWNQGSEFEKFLAPVYAAAAVAACTEVGADVFVACATSVGKDFAPRVAAALEAGQASDILAVNEDGSLRRPMYAGNVIADVEITTEKKVVTVRATGFDPAQESGSAGSVQEFSCPAVEGMGEVLGYEIAQSERPELGDAEVVVSGGRALQSEENFQKYIFPLADAFGAAIGASRAAVDSGYAPNDWQVGQTGKVVAPSLYVAVGISGAIQHLAGMKDSKVIVAINKDPDAPIYEIADYGLVADLYEVVEPLTEKVKQAKAS
ncbi:MAG: electron transfer flavoprotein subunit alpha/FixB family protein [Bdellovibrionales bacterium]|nr:electron transfer flavoprotein subunit alpha/FixB family protein [Bdellovibrionales bacterium]